MNIFIGNAFVYDLIYILVNVLFIVYPIVLLVLFGSLWLVLVEKKSFKYHFSWKKLVSIFVFSSIALSTHYWYFNKTSIDLNSDTMNRIIIYHGTEKAKYITNKEQMDELVNLLNDYQVVRTLDRVGTYYVNEDWIEVTIEGTDTTYHFIVSNSKQLVYENDVTSFTSHIIDRNNDLLSRLDDYINQLEQ